jgi:hypothetical protein
MTQVDSTFISDVTSGSGWLTNELEHGVPFTGRDQRVVQNLWLSKMTVVSSGRVYIYNKLSPQVVTSNNALTHTQAYKHKLKYPCLALPSCKQFTQAVLPSSSNTSR